MTVVVTFLRPSGLAGGWAGAGIGSVRAQERLAVGGTTTTTTVFGDVVLIGNSETSMIAVAFGTTPDAAALNESAITSAGFPIGAGQVGVPLTNLPVGSKINAKVVP